VKSKYRYVVLGAAVLAAIAVWVTPSSAPLGAAVGLSGTTGKDRVHPVGTVNMTELAAAPQSTAHRDRAETVPEVERAAALARLWHTNAGTHDPDIAAASGGSTSSDGDSPDPDALASVTAHAAAPSSAVVNGGKGISGFHGVGIQEMETAGTGQYEGSNGGLEPPDQALCVGNGFVLEGVNTAWKVWSTQGIPKTAAVPITQFFRIAPGGQPGPSSFVSDPRCIYDSVSKRFFTLTLEADEASGITQIPFLRAHTYIAVSKTSDPTGDWNIFNIDVTDDGQNGTPLHASCPCIDDQPLMGIDANGVYITANEYSDSEIFPVPVPGQVNQVFNTLPDYRLGQSQVYALSKSDLLAGNAPAMQSFDTANIPVPAADQGTPGAVWSELQPASSPPNDRSARLRGGVEYFMSQLDFAYTGDNRIAVWALTNTASLRTGHPAVALQNTVITTLSPTDRYAAPLYGVDQKDGPHPLGDQCGCPEEQLNANDDRMNQVMLTNNALWGALNTALPATTPGGTGAAADPRAGIMYFQVRPSIDGSGKLNATMQRDGYIQVAGNNVIFPSVVANNSGFVGAFFTLTGLDYFPSTAFARLDDLKPGKAPAVSITAAGAQPEDGFSGYPTTNGVVPIDPDSGKGVARWGDYSAAGVDEHNCLWGAAEYIPNGSRDPNAGNWSTFVTRVQAPGCTEPPIVPETDTQNVNPCAPLFTDASGDDVQGSDLSPVPGTQGQNPQLDIVQGDLSVSSDGSTLTTTLTIANLSTALAAGGQGNEYYFYWTYQGIVYFTNVEVGPTGTVTYSDGTQSSSGRTYRSHADTGTFTLGPNGKVAVSVPTSVIGSPTTGSVLFGGNGETRELTGGALVIQYDAAGPHYDYLVGATCTAPAS
jgi:hypothetical protein